MATARQIVGLGLDAALATALTVAGLLRLVVLGGLAALDAGGELGAFLLDFLQELDAAALALVELLAQPGLRSAALAGKEIGLLQDQHGHGVGRGPGRWWTG
mgnify:CR=1 FL=1